MEEADKCLIQMMKHTKIWRVHGNQVQMIIGDLGRQVLAKIDRLQASHFCVGVLGSRGESLYGDLKEIDENSSNLTNIFYMEGLQS